MKSGLLISSSKLIANTWQTLLPFHQAPFPPSHTHEQKETQKEIHQLHLASFHSETQHLTPLSPPHAPSYQFVSSSFVFTKHRLPRPSLKIKCPLFRSQSTQSRIMPGIVLLGSRQPSSAERGRSAPRTVTPSGLVTVGMCQVALLLSHWPKLLHQVREVIESAVAGVAVRRVRRARRAGARNWGRCILRGIAGGVDLVLSRGQVKTWLGVEGGVMLLVWMIW